MGAICASGCVLGFVLVVFFEGQILLVVGGAVLVRGSHGSVRFALVPLWSHMRRTVERRTQVHLRLVGAPRSFGSQGSFGRQVVGGFLVEMDGGGTGGEVFGVEGVVGGEVGRTGGAVENVG